MHPDTIIMAAVVEMDESAPMETVFVDVIGLPTKVLTWGRRLNEPFRSDETQLVLLVPGAPGLVEFYEEFLQTIWNDFERRIPVWAVAYGGLNELPGQQRSTIPDYSSDAEKCYDLLGQVEHKAAFIAEHVPAGVKIHLIGHSIGAWMCLQILNRQAIRGKLIDCYFLFPALDRLAHSPLGIVFKYVLKPSYRILEALYTYILMAMPEAARRFVVSVPFRATGSTHVFPIFYEHISSPAPLVRCYRIGASAIERIQTLDVDLVRRHSDILHIYYGSVDLWVPVSRFENMKRNIPEIDARLCESGLAHGFVIDHSKRMADILCDWIRSNRHRTSRIGSE